MPADNTPDVVLVRRDDLREALNIVQARLYDENLPAWDYRLLAAVNAPAATVEYAGSLYFDHNAGTASDQRRRRYVTEWLPVEVDHDA